MNEKTKYMVLFHSFFLCARLLKQKLGSSLIYLFYLHTIIWQKHLVLFHLFFLSLCRTIRPKLGYSLFFFLLFVHDHSTKIRGYSSFLYSWQYCPNISSALFMAVLLLYFVCYVHGSTAFTFRPPYSLPYCPYISYTVFMEVSFLYFVCYIHGYMKSWRLSSFFSLFIPNNYNI